MKRVKALRKIKARRWLVLNVDYRPLRWYEWIFQRLRRNLWIKNL